MHGINEIAKLNEIAVDNYNTLKAQGVSFELTEEQKIARQGGEVQPIGQRDGAQG